MEFSIDGFLVLLHVLFAALWFGGGAFQVLVVGKALQAAGPNATGFMVALAKRGGIGKYFAINGGLTILFGAIVYYRQMNVIKDLGLAFEPFEGRWLWITLGAILAVLTYLHGMTSNMPTEKKWMALLNGLKGPPTKEEGMKLQEYGMKLGKAGMVSVAMLFVTIVLMLMSRVYV